ncbi:hypothetical protein F2P45_29580 [Massilia sp. CCM 8733]|uniref:Uncharacterized protein n=1 Tax=Massilia mucilaginosa TaxID=2609282 RepID=A0ABX0P1M4_9BURK|nr:hypothetical protein [Massilia mucilaginosa]NHZ93130.1 hypothetical protein [Massilia mucilaginosa]
MLSLMLARPALASDISGVRIGSTLSEASLAIKSANNAFAIKPFKIVERELTGLSATRGNRDPDSEEGAADEFIVLQNAAGKVWFVARYQRMVPGSRVSLDALLGSLTQKFGEPTLRPEPGPRGWSLYSWDTDREGKRVKGADGNIPCKSIALEGTPLAGGRLRAPSSIPHNCGMRVMLTDVFERDGMVNRFILTVIDVKTASDDIERARRRHEADIARERKSGIKPQI